MKWAARRKRIRISEYEYETHEETIVQYSRTSTSRHIADFPLSGRGLTTRYVVLPYGTVPHNTLNSNNIQPQTTGTGTRTVLLLYGFTLPYLYEYGLFIKSLQKK